VLQPGDSYAALLYIVLPQTQTDLLSSRAEQMINSLKVTSPAPPTPEVAVGGDWQTYTYPGGLFTLDIPADWEATTGSAPDEVRARFSNPEGTAWVELSITEADAALSGVEREALLATYAEEAIGENRNFEMAEQVVPQPDDSLLLSFAYQRDRDSKVFLADAYAQQDDTRVTILALFVQEEHASDTMYARLLHILNSYRIDPSVSL
jgi:hypothetical protein